MSVLKALRQTPRALQRNPVVFVPVLVVMLLQLPQLILRSVHPLLASVVSLAISLVFVFLTPFFMAGVIGMADEALGGRTSLSTFVDDGKSNYVSVLVAYLLIVGVNFVLGFVAFVAALVGGFAFLGGASFGAVGMGIIAVLGVVALVVVLAYIVFVFLVQFYGQAIVLDGYGALDGLKHSVAVVRNNLVSTLGYTAVVIVIGGLAGLGFGLLSLLSSPQPPEVAALPHLSLAASLGVALVVVALGTLVGGFFGVFSVAFYRTITR
ncbi:hypothetical protein ACFQJD_11720 [Haloplanus sp. GCM10025708]|uniref:DUF7847 domain-containing protein n=1 Tax=Haloplanus sp. GCM10025708 TaxID=3252679 RepID=UPI00360BEE94